MRVDVARLGQSLRRPPDDRDRVQVVAIVERDRLTAGSYRGTALVGRSPGQLLDPDGKFPPWCGSSSSWIYVDLFLPSAPDENPLPSIFHPVPTLVLLLTRQEFAIRCPG